MKLTPQLRKEFIGRNSHSFRAVQKIMQSMKAEPKPPKLVELLALFEKLTLSVDDKRRLVQLMEEIGGTSIQRRIKRESRIHLGLVPLYRAIERGDRETLVQCVAWEVERLWKELELTRKGFQAFKLDD